MPALPDSATLRRIVTKSYTFCGIDRARDAAVLAAGQDIAIVLQDSDFENQGALWDTTSVELLPRADDSH
jgi:hypothetical protein